MSIARGQYPAATRNRKVTIECLKFTTNGGSAPTVYTDDGKILAATPFTVTATGRIKINLLDRWNTIYALCDMEDVTAGDGAELYATSAGMSAANYVEIKTVNGGALADTTSAIVHVFLFLSH